MRKLRKKYIFGLLMYVASFGVLSAVLAADDIDQDALAILERSSNFLVKANNFSMHAEIGFDVVQPSGQKIEFGAMRKVTIRRPNRVHIGFQRRDGQAGEVFFNGEDIIMFNKVENAYSKAARPGNIENALEFLTNELKVPIPLQNFISADTDKVIVSEVITGRYGGESIIDGVPCDHLAFQMKEVDYQIWIERGQQPLPRRLVITYKQEEGQPQFWAQIINWDLAPDVSDSSFNFEPPKNAEQIPFIAVKAKAALMGGDK